MAFLSETPVICMNSLSIERCGRFGGILKKVPLCLVCIESLEEIDGGVVNLRTWAFGPALSPAA